MLLNNAAISSGVDELDDFDDVHLFHQQPTGTFPEYAMVAPFAKCLEIK